ncbi:MAG TPA: hypothetical protein VKT82_31585 [Ktedonobacterales bacterium]|nr:hypothetical protein [Ktedonobacterales bacterium]
MNHPMIDEPSDSRSTLEGTAVFDVAGERVGTLSVPDPQAGHLVVQQDGPVAQDLYLPFSLIGSQERNGIFLNVSKEELQADRWKVRPSGSERGAAAPASEGLISQGVAVMEATPQTHTLGRAVIADNSSTVTQGTASIEQRSDTITQGTDTIEPEGKKTD